MYTEVLLIVSATSFSGVTAWESLLAHVVTQGVLMGIQAALALIMMFLVFKVPCVGYMGDVILLVFLTGLTGMCFGKCTNGQKHDISVSRSML